MSNQSLLRMRFGYWPCTKVNHDEHPFWIVEELHTPWLTVSVATSQVLFIIKVILYSDPWGIRSGHQPICGWKRDGRFIIFWDGNIQCWVVHAFRDLVCQSDASHLWICLLNGKSCNIYLWTTKNVHIHANGWDKFKERCIAPEEKYIWLR